MRFKSIGGRNFQDTLANDLIGNVYYLSDGVHEIDKQAWLQPKLAHYESEFQKLKEVSSIVELALWRVKMDKSSHGQSTMD
jgi:hypothetical protein